MANMLGSKSNCACICCNEPAVDKRVERKRENRRWLRDYEAGEYTNPVAQFHWDCRRIDLAEENEANLAFTEHKATP